MRKLIYTVVIEPAGKKFSAYVPDLPGCVATGATEAKVLHEMKKAIRFHIEGILEDGQTPPRPRSSSPTVEMQLGL